MKPLFITLEGLEGSGKTTQARLLEEYFKYKGRDVVLTREPGGTVLGTAIRKLLLESGHVHPVAELLLFLADRNQHIQEVILPALKKGAVVICDRFYHSTFAYQAGGRKVEKKAIEQANAIAIEGVHPDITFLIDIPVEIGFERKKAGNMQLDRIELEDKTFHSAIRQAYLDMAGQNMGMITVDGNMDKKTIHQAILSELISKGLVEE